MKKKYIVHLKVYATATMDVYAESEAEAREIAENEAEAPCLCHQCANDLDVSDIGEILEITEADE